MYFISIKLISCRPPFVLNKFTSLFYKLYLRDEVVIILHFIPLEVAVPIKHNNVLKGK